MGSGNGREALHRLEITPIDLMLTDIRMPIMEGIELIQQCRMRFPQLWSIVLSNYAEFDLAQMALRCGAKNYLLKATISKESLLSELNMAFANSQREKLDRSGLDSNELLMVQNSLFYERLHQHIDTSELLKRSLKLHVQVFQFTELQSMFAILEVDRFAEWCSMKFNNEPDLAIYALMNVAVEVIKQFLPRNELFHLANARFVLLDIWENSIEHHTVKMKEIQQALSQFLKLDVSLITGYPFTTLDTFFETIRAAETDIDQLFYKLPASVLYRNECMQTRHDIDLYSFFQSIYGIDAASAKHSDRFVSSSKIKQGWLSNALPFRERQCRVELRIGHPDP